MIAIPAPSALLAVARSERPPGQRGAAPDAAAFETAAQQARARGDAAALPQNSGDDTVRALARADANPQTQLSQSQFDRGDASTIQPPGRLPAPEAAFARGASNDPAALRETVLEQRAPGAALEVTEPVPIRRASTIESNQAGAIGLARQLAADTVSLRQAAVPDSSRQASRESRAAAANAPAADAAGPQPFGPQLSAQMLRQYQQVGASTAQARSAGPALDLTA